MVEGVRYARVSPRVVTGKEHRGIGLTFEIQWHPIEISHSVRGKTESSTPFFQLTGIQLAFRIERKEFLDPFAKLFGGQFGRTNFNLVRENRCFVMVQSDEALGQESAELRFDFGWIWVKKALAVCAGLGLKLLRSLAMAHIAKSVSEPEKERGQGHEEHQECSNGEE